MDQFTQQELGITFDPAQAMQESVDKSQKLYDLANRKQAKIESLSGKVGLGPLDRSNTLVTTEDGYVDHMGNKIANEYTPEELQYVIGRTYKEKGVFETPQGYMTYQGDELVPYQGDASELGTYYAFGTKGDEDVKKTGTWGGLDPRDRYSQDYLAKYGQQVGPEGVDVTQQDMRLLMPREYVSLLENLQHGNKYALENREARQREGELDAYRADRARLGSGTTEFYQGGYEGAFGGAGDIGKIADTEQLWSDFSNRFGLAGQSGIDAQVQSVMDQITQETAKNRGFMGNLGQVPSAAATGIVRGAVNLADAVQELVTWIPQEIAKRVTGNDEIDIDLIPDGFKEEVFKQADALFGYDRAVADYKIGKLTEAFKKANIDVTSAESLASIVTDPKNRELIGDEAWEILKDPSITAAFLTEIIGAGGALKVGATLVGKVFAKTAPKLGAAVSGALKTNETKTREALKAAKLAGANASEMKAIRDSYTTGKMIADGLTKGGLYANADLAVRMNEDITQFTENNNGEGPSPQKVLEMLVWNRVLSSAEMGAVKMEAQLGLVTKEALQQGITNALAKATAHIGKSIAVETVQETADAIGQQINQKLGSAAYEGKTLDDILEETSAEILTGSVIGAVAGGQVSATSEAARNIKANLPSKEKEAKASAVRPEQMDKVKVDPTDVSYENTLKYGYNNMYATGGSEAVSGIAKVADDVVYRTQGKEILQDARLSDSQKVADLVELVEIASEKGKKPVDGLVDNIMKSVPGLDRTDVERQVLGAQERGAMVGSVAAKDAEAVQLLKQAENAYGSRDKKAIDAVVAKLEAKVAELDDTVYSELVKGLTGDRVAVAEAEVKTANKAKVEKITTLADDMTANPRTRGQRAKEIVDTLESEGYTLGSSAKALEVIGAMYESIGTPSAKMNRAIDQLAKENGVTPEQVAAVKKTFEMVRKEASSGPVGYKTYGKVLEELNKDPELNAESIEQLKSKARRFYDSQVRAVDALREGIARAKETRNQPLEPEAKIVTNYRKLDGQMFDIWTDDKGVAKSNQIALAGVYLKEKLENIAGLKKYVLGDEVPSKVISRATELAEKVKEAPVAEVKEKVKLEPKKEVKQEVAPEPKKEVKVETKQETKVTPEKVGAEPVETVTETKTMPTRSELDIVDLVRYIDEQRMMGLDDLNSTKDQNSLIRDIMAKLDVSKEEATALYERATKEFKGQVIKNVLKNNIANGKAPMPFNKEGKLQATLEEKFTMGVLERDPSKVVTYGRPTVLNSVDVMGDKVLEKAAKSGIDALASIIEPMQKNEADDSTGGLESVNSPSRTLIFDKNGQMNANVVAAMYTGIVEAINMDNYMLSPYAKSASDIALMLGMDEEEVSMDLYNLLKDKGILLDTMATSVGNNVLNLLGLKRAKVDGVDLQNYPRLVADIGNAAIHIGIAKGWLEIDNSVKAADFSVAMGNEPIKGGATMNFVQLTEMGLGNKVVLSKIGSQLKDKIPEVDELRPKPKMSPFSKAEIDKYKNSVRNDLAQQRPTELMSEAIQKAMETEYELDMGLADEVLANEGAVMRLSGYIAEDSDEFARLGFEDKDSQKGINQKIVRDMDALKDAVKEGKGKSKLSMWFAHYTGRNGRLYMESSTLNPMNEKEYHRWLVQPKDMEVSYEVSGKGKDVVFTSEGKDVTHLVKYAIAQGLGYSVDKKASKGIKAFAEAALSIGKGDLAKLKKDLLEGKSFKMGEYEAELEHVGHMLQVVKFLEDVARGNTTVTSKMSAEFDAVTSGFGLKLLQLPIIRNLYEYLAKVGIIVPNKLNKGTAVGRNSDADSMNDFLASDGVLDNYQTLATDVNTPATLGGIVDNAKEVSKGEGSRVRSQLQGLDGLWTDMRKVLPQKINGQVSSELRNLFKYPFMTFNYARSVNNIKKGLATDITRDLLSKIAKADLSAEKNAGLKVVADGLARLIGQDIQVALREVNPRNLQVKGKGSLQDVLETMVLHSYGAEVEKVFKDQFGEFAHAQDVITDTFKFTYEVFNRLYAKKVEETRKLNKGRVLTAEEDRKIVKGLLKVFPVIAGPASGAFADSPLQEGTFDDGVAIVRERRVGRDDVWYKNTQFVMKGKKYRTANTRIKTFNVPGVAGVVIPIHFTDATILANTLLENKGGLMTIHDAVIPKLTEAPNVVGNYNKHTLEVNREYSFVESVNDMLNRVRDAVNELDPETRKELRGIELPWKPSFIDNREWETADRALGANWDTAVSSLDTLTNITSAARSDVMNALSSGNAKVMHMAGLNDMVYNTEIDMDVITVNRLDSKQTEEMFENIFGEKALELLNCIGKG